MLVISEDLALSAEEDALPDGTPLILYENRVTTSNVSADSEDADYPITNIANPSTNLEWRGSADSPTPTTVQVDITVDSISMVDGVGIARHNFGSSGIAVAIYAVSNDSPLDEVLVIGPQIPPNDEPMLFQFTARSFFKLRIELTCPAGIVPRMAVVYVGKILITERGFDVGSDFVVPRFARKTDVVNGMSHAGDFLGRITLSRSVEGAMAIWKHFRPDWYREFFDPFVDAAQADTPFFMSWSPLGYPYEVGFLWLAEDPQPPTAPITGRISVALRMDGIIE